MNYLILNLVIFNRIISEIIYAPASARRYFLAPAPPPFHPISSCIRYPPARRVPLGGIGTRRRFFSKSSPTVSSVGSLPRSATGDGRSASGFPRKPSKFAGETCQVSPRRLNRLLAQLSTILPSWRTICCVFVGKTNFLESPIHPFSRDIAYIDAAPTVGLNYRARS